mgnify:CR=1 FL=1
MIISKKLYKHLYETYCWDYSRGLRSWEDLKEAIKRLNAKVIIG